MDTETGSSRHRSNVGARPVGEESKGNEMNNNGEETNEKLNAEGEESLWKNEPFKNEGALQQDSAEGDGALRLVSEVTAGIKDKQQSNVNSENNAIIVSEREAKTIDESGSRPDGVGQEERLARLEKRLDDIEARLTRAEQYNRVSEKTITELLSTTAQVSSSGKEMANVLNELLEATGNAVGTIEPLIPYLEKIRDKEQMDEDLRRLFEK